MKKSNVTHQVLELAVTCLGYKKEQKTVLFKTKDGGTVTVKDMKVYHTPEGWVYVNIPNIVTWEFETEEEYKGFAEKRFREFASEKEMYISGCGMSEETWNAWNGTEDEE